MVALVIVTVLVVGGIVALVILSHRKEWKMTSSTTGQVVRCDEREVRDAVERREETLVVCRYHVTGKDHEIQRLFPGRQGWRYKVGSAIEVHYNPAEPEMATFG